MFEWRNVTSIGLTFRGLKVEKWKVLEEWTFPLFHFSSLDRNGPSPSQVEIKSIQDKSGQYYTVLADI